VVEVIPTWTDGESVELYQCERFNRFDENELREKVEQKMREVRDRGVAQPPKEKLSCKVVLDAKELSHLFADIAGELDFASVYSHMNSYSIGDSIQKERRGDAISVTMRGAIEGSSASALFDVDGYDAVGLGTFVLACGKRRDRFARDAEHVRQAVYDRHVVLHFGVD
jgi:predicted Zn-dependent protease